MNSMTSRANQLLHEMLELPADERAAVATELLASLEDAEPTDIHEIEAAWAKEIERRAQSVLSGESTGKPWDEVRRNIETNLRTP
jgi:putative addiction module component (TIGR02574 family)